MGGKEHERSDLDLGNALSGGGVRPDRRAAAGGLLEHHAEFPPASRELTFQILAVG